MELLSGIILHYWGIIESLFYYNATILGKVRATFQNNATRLISFRALFY